MAINIHRVVINELSVNWCLLKCQAWLELLEQAVEETDESRIHQNREAQHKYLTWRAEKVPLICPLFFFFLFFLFGYHSSVKLFLG